jgi:hypothetical protein
MKNQWHQRYISRMRGGGIPEESVMKLGTLVINHANFHLHWMNSFCASSGQKRGFCLWNAYGSYYIALHYRAGKWLSKCWRLRSPVLVHGTYWEKPWHLFVRAYVCMCLRLCCERKTSTNVWKTTVVVATVVTLAPHVSTRLAASRVPAIAPVSHWAALFARVSPVPWFQRS